MTHVAKIPFSCFVMALVEFISEGMWLGEKQGAKLHDEVLESVEVKFIVLSLVHYFQVYLPHQVLNFNVRDQKT